MNQTKVGFYFHLKYKIIFNNLNHIVMQLNQVIFILIILISNH